MNKIIKYLIIFIIILFLVESYCRYNKSTLLEVVHPDWFKDVNSFPKELGCKKNCNVFDKHVKSGYSKMRDSTIVFSGLCINIEKNIPGLKLRIEHIGNYFKEYKFVIFENDSTDDTRQLLNEWSKKNSNIKLVPCIEDDECKLKVNKAISTGTFSSDRMKRMANYRNRLLYYIRQNYIDYNYLMMFDLDITGPWSIDGIADSFSKSSKWDVVTAFGLNGITGTFGKPVYYDFIAYRDEKLNINKNIFDFIEIIYKMDNIKNKNKLIKTTSSFAGMAIYKMEIFKNPNINYIPIDDVYICEHIILADNLIRNGFDKIYINPNMMILVGAQGDVQRYPWY
jgi:hypothetical protein